MEAAIDRIMQTYDLLLNRTTAASDEARAKVTEYRHHAGGSGREGYAPADRVRPDLSAPARRQQRSGEGRVYGAVGKLFHNQLSRFERHLIPHALRRLRHSSRLLWHGRDRQRRRCSQCLEGVAGRRPRRADAPRRCARVVSVIRRDFASMTAPRSAISAPGGGRMRKRSACASNRKALRSRKY